ncbi:rho GTPase-activating protein 1 [Neltuma alba]|uniref:rho GTPase-activating protein 1 n=1 Tax=Neltuma alba TaxID=207710 RepID=UPI0010A2B7EB|nr:rho GTPase-activating protein 1 [Prosopis alba]
MTEVLHCPYSHFSSSSSRSSSPPPPPSLSSTALPSNGILFIQETQTRSSSVIEEHRNNNTTAYSDTDQELKDRDNKHRSEQLSVLALVATLFRKPLIGCKSNRRELCKMEIGWPTNVRHVAHVTFDRFNGFLGLPDEFEPEVPRRPPSASATVFGVSTESMQLSFDSRGNSVPTILLLMQKRLYSEGGLQAEGIFRINAENSQEEYVRDQLNRGVVPEGVDVHCLAGLIKAWFRELPIGVLDSLSPEQVMKSQTEEECAELARNLPPTEAALLDWAINLMTDVVQYEHLNKMNARNIAMVFAPNMTQMADPLTALMYAVQVMNFLKTLILRTLRERRDSIVEPSPGFHLEPSDDNSHHSPIQFCQPDSAKDNEEAQALTTENTVSESNPAPDSHQETNLTGGESGGLETSSENPVCHEDLYCDYPPKGNVGKSKTGQSSNSNSRKGSKKTRDHQSSNQGTTTVEKTKGTSKLSRINSRSEKAEPWR